MEKRTFAQQAILDMAERKKPNRDFQDHEDYYDGDYNDCHGDYYDGDADNDA